MLNPHSVEKIQITLRKSVLLKSQAQMVYLALTFAAAMTHWSDLFPFLFDSFPDIANPQPYLPPTFSCSVSGLFLRMHCAFMPDFRGYARPFTWLPSNFPEIDNQLS